MKSSAIIRLLLLLPLLSTLACNRQQLDPKAVSNICDQVEGAEAIYWDLRNGIIRTDLPKGVPTLENPGGAYGHPGFPLLGFSYPEGWSPVTIADNNFGHTVGVDLIRGDNQAVWRSFSTSLNGFVPILDIVAAEINQALAFLGNPPIDNVVCTNDGEDRSLGNIISQFESRLIRAGSFTIQVNVNVNYVDGLPSTFVSNQVTVGPTVEYQDLIADVFLPIDWQLLLKPEGDDLNRDSDNDGVWDVNDRFPNDPSKW
ncbi:MAG: hypothetical protein AAFP02_22715 [Bacteroidota bacterium]